MPLVVLRMPEFAELAWRTGKRAAQRLERLTVSAFSGAAQRLLRVGDIVAHEPGSDWFAIAMLAPARDGSILMSIDVRAALERIAAAMSLATGRRIETGWVGVSQPGDFQALDATIFRALEQGARDRERYEFVATIGHELRTPLTSIRGYIETLIEDELDEPTRLRFLSTVRSESLRLSNLVDGMLDFSLLDTHAQSCDISERAGAVVELLAPVAAKRNIGFTLACDPGAHVRMNADACMHALINVAENAVKYGRDGGLVEISVQRSGDRVITAIEDDGPGIEPALRERVFERGVRGNDTAKPGSGIGLALVRNLIERAGGSVILGDSPLGGARFTLSLPAAERGLEALRAESRSLLA